MVISFLRHEVLFNNKKSIVINVRDLTAQESLFESKTKIKQLNKAVRRLSNELDRPISRFRKNADQLARDIGMQPVIQRHFYEIQKCTMLTGLKIRNFQDFGKLSTSRLKANVEQLNAKTET